MRRSEAIVLPQRANERSLNAENAHATNDTEVHRVLPERTAPSQIMPSQPL